MILSISDRLKAGLLRAIRPRNDENTSDQTTQKNTIAKLFLTTQKLDLLGKYAQPTLFYFRLNRSLKHK